MSNLTTVLLLAVILTSCTSSSDTTNSLLRTNINSRQDKKATLFLRKAGATVDDSYQVTIANKESALDKNHSGNTFIVDTDHGKTTLNESSVTLKWLANDSLQIEYDSKLRVFKQEKMVDNVTVFYKATYAPE